MNGSLAESRKLVSTLRAGLGAGSDAEMLLAPPYVYIAAVREWIAGSPILLGAQDVADRQSSGAFTGEVSGAMLADVGCTYAIVGHSERRTLYGESDEIVAAKFNAAQAAQLVPILCVGETLAERDAGTTDRIVSRQLEAVLDTAGVAA